MSFVHLHTHTQYSLLDGSNKISEYIKRVKELGMNAAAITDHGAMFGVIDFYKTAKANGINPILGCEVYVAPESRFDRDVGKGENKYYHLVLLCENNKGYDNLKKIVSIGYIDGFYYRPRVDFETLEKYHEGLICLSACLAGEVPRLIEDGHYESAKACAIKYRDLFGKNNYFLEMQDHGIPLQKSVNTDIIRISKETGIPLVVTNDCHYTFDKDERAHDVLLCMQTGKRLDDPDRMRYEGGQYYVKSEEEMSALFPFAKEAIENTGKIADRCKVEIEFGVTKLPHFDVPAGHTSESYLREICENGLKKRYEDLDKESYDKIKNQLDFELETIKKMGYVDYFLIVWDFINYARTNNIPVGPGRGSAAGSLVAYSTGITDIDPIKYQLLFERFLNPERVSMPDIDIDFCINKRGDVIDYVVRKYGEECVSQIITFGTLQPRAVIRDVGKVMGLPIPFVSSITNMIPKELKITIESALKKNPELRKLYDSDERVKDLIDTAKELEGLPKNASTHAAGVVITERPITDYVPLAQVGEKRGDERSVVTEFEKDTIEELGLLKMDFLGLRNLTIIDDALKLIKETRDEDLDLEKIPYDDSAVFSLISSGKTEGVFQLESPGMMSFMKELRPESLEDIIAGIALYRPGPMQFIPQYIRGKNDKESISYECEELRDILSPTYGCIVYQEQVMQIVRDLAGYSLGRSDILRRAMSKKKADVMAKEKDIFINGDPESGVPGCIKNGIDPKVANDIYDKMLDFAEYAFNKSHAASYAVITYRTAYLKTYYPKEYFAALLTSVMGTTTDVAKYIAAAREMGMVIEPPNINESIGNFTVRNNKIYYGLYAIKSVGQSVIDTVIMERNSHGPFSTINDFIDRIVRIKREGEGGKMVAAVNKKAVESLIFAGAFDGMEGNRKQKYLVYADLMAESLKRAKDDLSGQMSLFDIVGESDKKLFSVDLPKVSEFSKDELLKNEKDVMGIYVSGHPLDDYRDFIRRRINATSEMFKGTSDEEADGSLLSQSKKYTLAGMITGVTTKFTRNNQPMAFVTLEDLWGSVEVIVFPNAYEKCRDILGEDNRVVVRGKASVELDADSKLICDSITSFEEEPVSIWIQMPTREVLDKSKEDLLSWIKQRPGKDRVIIYIMDTKEKMQHPSTVNGNEEFLSYLREKFGEDNIKAV